MKKWINDKIQKFKKKSISYKILVIVFIFILVTITSTAWLCDDAYISFRVVDNFINGHGLRWNTFERVQVFTNPLLVLCMSFLSFFTREVYFTSLLFSIVISASAIYILLFKISKNYVFSIGIGLVLMLSKSFISFTTSGLENCLTFFLLALYVFYFFKDNKYKQKDILRLTIIAAFILINRLDIILLILPSLAYIYLFKRDTTISFKRVLLLGFIGMLPFIIWEIFSIIYYGFPFPNTAYAKLGTNIAIIEYIKRGIKYYIANFLYDPITLLSILCVFAYMVLTKKVKENILFAGVILYLLYIIRVGGDFMNGRFFTAPFFVSLMIINYLFKSKKQLKHLALIFIILIAFQNVFTQVYESGIIGSWVSRFTKGVANERAYYFNATALKNNLSENNIQRHYWSQEGITLKVNNSKFAQFGSIGFAGYYAGSNVKVLDNLALADPLLVRMPICDNQEKWRIGHIYRMIPEGYIETIKTGTNKIENSNIKEYYDKLKVITQDKLFSKKRMQVIINMNLGKYNYLLKNAFEEGE